MDLFAYLALATTAAMLAATGLVIGAWIRDTYAPALRARINYIKEGGR